MKKLHQTNLWEALGNYVWIFVLVLTTYLRPHGSWACFDSSQCLRSCPVQLHISKWPSFRKQIWTLFIITVTYLPSIWSTTIIMSMAVWNSCATLHRHKQRTYCMGYRRHHCWSINIGRNVNGRLYYSIIPINHRLFCWHYTCLAKLYSCQI